MPSHRIHPGWRIAAGGGAWLGGVALQLQQPALWAPGAYGALFAAGALLMLLAAWRGRFGGAAIVALALIGFAGTGLRAEGRAAERLDPALEGRDLVLTGVIAALPDAGATGTRFLFEVDEARAGGSMVAIPPLLSLGWYSTLPDDEAAAEPRATLRAGQRWRLPVRLKQPHGAMNPGGFDVELWLWERGVRATGSVRGSARGAVAPVLLAEGVAHPVERLRQALRDAIQREVDDVRAAGVLAALAVGDQAAIERGGVQRSPELAPPMKTGVSGQFGVQTSSDLSMLMQISHRQSSSELRSVSGANLGLLYSAGRFLNRYLRLAQ